MHKIANGGEARFLTNFGFDPQLELELELKIVG